MKFKEYLNEKSADDKYVCAKNGNNKACHWSGNEPVKQKKGNLTCPVCGGDAVKNWEFKGKKK